MDDVTGLKRIKGAAGSAGDRARTRILDTAENLFAKAGPTAVTLRSIAAAADTNVAAVNYYFGSKEKLFEEMFLRRVVPLNDERLSRLATCMTSAEEPITLEGVVRAYVMPALELSETASSSARAIVVQYSLGRVLAMPEVSQMLARYYTQVREAFVAALHRVAPHLTMDQVVWRYYWMGGSLMVALAVSSGLDEAADGRARPGSVGAGNAMDASLITFLVQGIRAPDSAVHEPEVRPDRSQ